MAFERRPVDITDYIRQSKSGNCFICEFLRGNPSYLHHEVWRNSRYVAFLDRYPTLPGKLLLAPVSHRSAVVDDFALDEYLELQGHVHRLGRALTRAVPTERLYVYSLGAVGGNAHVHWHLAALPPGVPYEQQQFHALMMENGVIAVGDGEMVSLAAKIRAELGLL
jgi:diadenosine tetraphosphate (Ap4A) HIT family hydrolase